MKTFRESGTASRIVLALLTAGCMLNASHANEPDATAPAIEPADVTAVAPTEEDPPATAAVASAAPHDRVVDRLRLDATAITGNRELPKVMSIVPWKPAEPPEGPERPMGSLIEELLAPVDRDEFRREITYYRDLTSQSSGVDAQPAGPPAAAVVPERSAHPSSPPGASIP
jgi:hypothetical protein